MNRVSPDNFKDVDDKPFAKKVNAQCEVLLRVAKYAADATLKAIAENVDLGQEASRKKAAEESEAVEADLRAFEIRLKMAPGYLIAATTAYRVNREEELLTLRASDILRELDELWKLPAERWPHRLPALGAPVFEALLGGFPFADVAYVPVALDGTGKAVAIPGKRPALVPADGRQQRQDLKHLLKESPSGLVKPSILPSFAEMVCRQAEADELAGMVRDTIALLSEMPDLRALTGHLARQWAPVATDIFERFIPAKFALLANAMEDDIDRASGILLRFVAQEAPVLFKELPVKPGTITDASRLAAATVEPVLMAGNLAERQKGFALLGDRAPSAFRQALGSMVERVELQYGKAINPTGMGRRTTRAYTAPASWVLINDVVDRIWPAKYGSSSQSTLAAILSIVDLVHTRGEIEFERCGSEAARENAIKNTGIGNTGGRKAADGKKGREARQLDVDQIRAVVTYRHARYQLNCALEFLESELRDVRIEADVKHRDSARLEATIRVLHRWREEIDWRLLHGAFERQMWRGAVPRFPQMKITHPLAVRVQKIVEEAQRLIDEMLATITARPAGQDDTVGVEEAGAGRKEAS